MATPSDVKALEGLDGYKYGFSDKDVSLFQTPRGPAPRRGREDLVA